MKEVKTRKLTTGVRLSEDKIDNIEILLEEASGYLGAVSQLRGRRKTKKVLSEERLYIVNLKAYAEKLLKQCDSTLKKADELDVTIH